MVSDESYASIILPQNFIAFVARYQKGFKYFLQKSHIVFHWNSLIATQKFISLFTGQIFFFLTKDHFRVHRVFHMLPVVNTAWHFSGLVFQCVQERTKTCLTIEKKLLCVKWHTKSRKSANRQVNLMLYCLVCKIFSNN